MQVNPSSYDQGARVLLQQENLTTCNWTNLKWLTATDKKILDTWNAAKNQGPSSPEYSLAKRQIQEVSHRHSHGFLGWLTRCYHRFLNLFGAGIKPQEEETLRSEISEGPTTNTEPFSASTTIIPPSSTSPSTPTSATKPFITTPTDHTTNTAPPSVLNPVISSPTVPKTASPLFSAPKKAHWNFKQKMTEGQSISQFLGKLLESFNGQVTGCSIRRDPDSSGYRIGFTLKYPVGFHDFQKLIKDQLIDQYDFFDYYNLIGDTLWFSASQTRDLVGESRLDDLQKFLEERCWSGSLIKRNGETGILYDPSYIEKIFQTFGTLEKTSGSWSLVMPSKDFDRFQAKIREESNGCIVCPGVGEASDKNLLEIHTLDGGQIQVIFKGRFKNYLEHGEKVPIGEDREDS